jgi:hypothetical protein
MDSFGDFLGGLFDRATQTFKSIADFEIAKIGAKAEAQKVEQESPAYQAANAFDGGGLVFSPNLLIYGGLGIVGLVVLKKMKVI